MSYCMLAPMPETGRSQPSQLLVVGFSKPSPLVTVQQPWAESETGQSQPSQLVVGFSKPSPQVTVQQPWVESETGQSQPSQLVVDVCESRPSHNMKEDLPVQESQEHI